MPMHSVYGDALDMKGVASVRTLISSPQSAGKMMEVVIFIDEGRHGGTMDPQKADHNQQTNLGQNSS